MITHALQQNSPEWHAYRAGHFNASDAPAMLGCSPYKTRSQLLHERHTGLLPEVDAATQRRFNDGHRFEALARPLAEKIIGQELYPVTGSSGNLSASFDGLTMCESIAWEHKSLNKDLRAVLTVAPEMADHEPANAIIPLHYRVQMQQQCMVSGAACVLFMASLWNDDDTLVEARHCYYASDAKLAADINAGWEQFAVDLAAYAPPAATAPAPTGRAPETLPALFITVKGEVTDSNLANFKEVALSAIRSVNRELTTDQNFADAEKAVKWCSDIEERVAGAKQNALSQTASIDALFKTMDDISAEARQVRLDLDKLIKARKVSLKSELLIGVQTQLADHVRSLNTRIGRDYMPHTPADFIAAIHGKKNFDSMRSALNAALANAKIEASAVADRIQANLSAIGAQPLAFLFSDLTTLVLKEPEFVAMTISSRVAQHQAQEAARIETERDRIAFEERTKAQAIERARADAEIAAATAQARSEANAQAQADAQAKRASDEAIAKAAQTVIPALPAAPFIPHATAADGPLGQPTLRIGQISERLGFNLTGDFLKTLGFEPAARANNAVLFHEADFGPICAALVRHIRFVAQGVAA